MGRSTPATLSEDAGGSYYKYRGDPEWAPGAARYRRPGTSDGPAASRAGKAARLAEFAGYLAQGLSAQQAGRLMGLAPRTSRTYERELEERQREEDDARTPQEITAELHAEIAARSPEHAALVAEFERADALRVRPSGGRDAHNARLMAERDERMREYAALRASGLDKMAARRRMDLSDTAGKRYEADMHLVTGEDAS
jgi:hypothetical protein